MVGNITRVLGGLQDIAFRFGVSAAPLRSTNEVRGVIRLLRPIRSPHGLIRIGPDADGGYLIPDDLDGVEVCFSPGVDNKVIFERQLAARGIRCHLADYSIAEIPDVAGSTFEKRFVGLTNEEPFTTLESWVERHTTDSTGDMLLQMDIEGWEYGSLLLTPSHVLRRFRILIVEFHDLRQIFEKAGNRMMAALFRKLSDEFYVVHIHPNNHGPLMTRGGLSIPRTIEVTFHRKDRVTSVEFATAFPHPLGRDCVAGKPAVPLPRCWYEQDSQYEI